MADLDEDLYYRTVAILEVEREACRKYRGLLEAQRAAAHERDFAAVLELADDVTKVQEELAQLEPVCSELRSIDQGRTSGPRTRAVASLIEALALETVGIEEQIRILTRAMIPLAGPTSAGALKFSGAQPIHESNLQQEWKTC